jgi:hypothetical protein
MKTLSILAIILSFAQCGSSMLVKNTSFKVEKAFYNNWIGVQPGVSGTKLEIHLKNASEIIFDSLYFKNKRIKVQVLQKEEITQLIGNYLTSKRINNDLTLAEDPTQEFQNATPIIKNIPFELKESEAILSYKKGKKTLYLKIINIKKIAATLFPSVNIE